MGTGVDREWEAAFGLTAPPCFALAAQRHMAQYGTTEEQLGARRREEPQPRGEESERALQQGRDAGPGAVLEDDRDAAAALHVLADHRRRGRRARRLGGARAHADRHARVDPRHRPGARRLPAHVAPRGLRALAGDEARRRRGVRDGGRRTAGRRPRRGARLLRHRRADRVRGARLLQEGRGGALRRRTGAATTAATSSSIRAAG